jgi:hypothetical protein
VAGALLPSYIAPTFLITGLLACDSASAGRDPQYASSEYPAVVAASTPVIALLGDKQISRESAVTVDRLSLQSLFLVGPRRVNRCQGSRRTTPSGTVGGPLLQHV